MAINKKKILYGIEGCGKSSTQLSSTFERLSPHEFAFYAGVSYDSLVEKQKWLIETFGGDQTQFPICATKVNERNRGCVWSAETPFRIPEEAKIVLVVQASITNCNFLQFESPSKMTWRTLIIDEFGFANFMVPGYDHQLLALIKDKLEGNSIPNISKAFTDHVYKTYSWEDYSKIMSEPFEPCFSAHWLELCKDKEVVVLTSEKLAVLALKALGFAPTEFKVEEDKLKKLAECVVQYHAARVNTKFFEVFNVKGWGVLPFDTIITNKAEGDLRCVNHTMARGSNQFEDQNVCSVISNIPNQQLRNITDAINTFSKDHVEFRDVQRLFYRDVLCQAVGRTCGFRGESAYILISHIIWKLLQENWDELGIPYKFELWKVSPELAIRLQEVADASDVDQTTIRFNKQTRISLDRQTAKSKLNSFIDNHFEEVEGFVTYDAINELFKAHKILTHDGNTPQQCNVAKLFGIKPKKRSVGGESQWVIEGIALKQADSDACFPHAA